MVVKDGQRRNPRHRGTDALVVDERLASSYNWAHSDLLIIGPHFATKTLDGKPDAGASLHFEDERPGVGDHSSPVSGPARNNS